MRKNTARKITTTLFLVLLIIISTINVFAITDTDQIKANIDENGTLVIYGEIELIEVKEGYYEAEVPIYLEGEGHTTASSPNAQMVWSLTRDANYANLYEINYTITATSLINGIVGDVKIVENKLFGQTLYEQKSYSQTFPATTVYSTTVGRMIATPGSSVRLSFANSRVYFLSHGWFSPSFNFTGWYMLE